MKKKKWKWYELLLLAGFVGVAICCILFLISYYRQTQTAKADFIKLSQMMHSTEGEVFQLGDKVENNISELQEENSDCIGWLQVEDTNIDYPIMCTPHQPEYYLRRNFGKQYSIAGTPFLDNMCNVFDSLNLIVHGHNMKDGSMFASLVQYQDKQYGLDHPQFTLYLKNEVRQYHLMAVLHFDLTLENMSKYYHLPNSRADFESYISFLEEESLYCGGYSAIWGERILTLSTCDNKTENGRILVVAKEIKK